MKVQIVIGDSEAEQQYAEAINAFMETAKALEEKIPPSILAAAQLTLVFASCAQAHEAEDTEYILSAYAAAQGMCEQLKTSFLTPSDDMKH